jgi:hypothetical protein
VLFRLKAEFLTTGISGEDVLGYLMRLNKWGKETALQVLTVDGYGSEYDLVDFPLRRLRPGDDWSPARSEEYAKRPTPFPPIILGYDWDWAKRRPRLVIRDGNHRVDAAKQRGDGTIRAYVPRLPRKASSLGKRPGLVGPVYHGTSASFDEWRLPEEHSLGEMGIHFGTLPQAEYVIGLGEGGFRPGGNIRPVYLRVHNPLRLEDAMQWTPQRIALELYHRRLMTRGEARRISHGEDRHDPKWYPFLRRWIEDRGYDAIVYRNQWEGRGDSYIVWHTEQIVPALG